MNYCARWVPEEISWQFIGVAHRMTGSTGATLPVGNNEANCLYWYSVTSLSFFNPHWLACGIVTWKLT